MKSLFQKEWPMETYISSWKLFRSMSDENELTSEHLLTRDNWPKREDVNILDIGCGDGLLIKKIIEKCDRSINYVHLLDPDEELLKQAYQNVNELQIVKKVFIIHNKIEKMVPGCFEKIDVILAVHIIYLLAIEKFKQMLYKLPQKVPLYLVLDKPNSIFTRLWKETAKKYYDRCMRVHAIIKKLPARQFVVKESSINSHISNPLNISRPEVKESILSILCYTEARDMDTQAREKVEKEIKNVIVDNKILCESACYEIIRK